MRSGYLASGLIIGHAWWLMWIPVAVSLGFDQVLHPNALILSLAVGAIGFTASVGLFWRALRPGNPSSEMWKTRLSGESIASAYLALEEIEKAQIE